MPSHGVPQVDGEEKKQKGMGAYIREQSLLRHPQLISIWLELCLHPCLIAGKTRKYPLLAGVLLPPTK